MHMAKVGNFNIRDSIIGGSLTVLLFFKEYSDLLLTNSSLISRLGESKQSKNEE